MPGGRRLEVALTVVLLAPAAASAKAVAARVVALPVENVTAVAEAADIVGAALRERLATRGWEVADDGRVEDLLREARARRVDSLTDSVRRDLLDRSGAAAVLFTTVETCLEGTNAIVAVSARLVGRDGELLWGGISGRSARGLEGALALRRAGEAREVALGAVEALTDDLPRPGEARVVPARRLRPRHLPAPAVARASSAGGDSRLRVIVTPFVNRTRARLAPRHLAQSLAIRLAASSGFEVVERAEVRAALVAEKIPTLDRLDADRLRRLAARLGARHYLRGSVWKWREGSSRTDADPPEVELELEVVDAESERVVWSSHHARKGSDYEGLLLRGTIPSAVALADQVVAEMLQAMLTAAPSPLGAAPEATRRRAARGEDRR